jgi:PAS domain S-box-containing protein
MSPSPVPAPAPADDTQRCRAMRAQLDTEVALRRAAIRVVSTVVPRIQKTVADQRESVRLRTEREHREEFSRSVLVVDDDAALRYFYAEAIERECGVPVYTAGNASEARTLFYRHRSGVVLMDTFLNGRPPEEGEGLPETGDRILRGFPVGVRSILCSGWTDPMTLKTMARNVRAIAMRKPLDATFTRVVRDLLDDVMPPYWCHLDPEAGFVAMSPDLASLLGHATASLVGVHWRELVAPEDLAESQAILRQNLDSGAGVTGFACRLRRSDGSTLRFSWDFSPLTAGVFFCVATPS